MQTILMVIHIIIAFFLVVVILLQRTDSDGLQGLSSSPSSMSGIISPRARANFMSKFASILAALFMINCLILANLAANQSKDSIVHQIESSKEGANINTVPEQQNSAPIAE